MSAVAELLASMLAPRLDSRAREWLALARDECARLPARPEARFPTLVSLASRKVPRGALEPSSADRDRARELVPGWNPERWSILDAARALLVLSRAHLEGPEGVAILDEVFRHADVGELCALHRSLQLLPGDARFAWRAGEGCRSSMSAVYEAAACDTGLPFARFDDLAWRQLVVKALFVGAPVARIHGLDRRLDAELARMVLDLVDERRSAGRGIPPGAWACLGAHGGARARDSMVRELAIGHPAGRAGAILGLARAGHMDLVAAHEAGGEADPVVLDAMARARAGRPAQDDYAPLHGS